MLYFSFIKLIKEHTFADDVCDLRIRKIKKTFFNQMNILLDWGKISSVIDKDYKKGKSVSGKTS